jgi:hypothetical protein
VVPAALAEAAGSTARTVATAVNARTALRDVLDFVNMFNLPRTI